jgi:hypothetical protein
MDPLITDGIDPALLRVLEKRGQQHDEGLRRRRVPAPNAAKEGEADNGDEAAPEAPRHELDDLA